MKCRYREMHLILKIEEASENFKYLIYCLTESNDS